MKNALNNIIELEINAIKKLLKELELQHEYIVKKDVFRMEECVLRIQEANKEVALLEMDRRKLIDKASMSEIINEINDEELNNNFRKIKKLLEETGLQKDSNELLIKQGLSFTNRMLNIINPKGNTSNTYNSYGKVKR